MAQQILKASALNILKELDELGLKHNFKFEKDGVVCTESGKKYRSDEIAIEASYRFEGESDPDDSSILYVLRAFDGTGGTLMDAYGALATPGVGEFMCRLADNRENSELMQLVPSRKTITVRTAGIDDRQVDVTPSR